MKLATLILLLMLMLICSYADDSSYRSVYEHKFLNNLEELQTAKSKKTDDVMIVRSHHIIFGLPGLMDNRHNFKPKGFTKAVPGVSLLFRESHILEHFEKMKSLLWGTQLWTKYDHKRMKEAPSLSRKWKEDIDLPFYANGEEVAGSRN